MILVDYIECQVADWTFAFRLDQVERVLLIPAFKKIDSEVPWIAGVINVSGNQIPLVSMRRLLKADTKRDYLYDHVVLIKLAEHRVALWLDKTSEVIKLNPASIRPNASYYLNGDLADGVAETTDGILLIQDAQKYFSHENITLFEQLLNKVDANQKAL